MQLHRNQCPTPPLDIHHDIKRDVALGRLATRQHGLISRPQLTHLGATSGWIARRVGNGQLIEIAPRVYAVLGAPTSWRRSALAAVMSTHPQALASHLTAAHLHGIGSRPVRLEVTMPRGRRPDRQWTIHQTKAIDPGGRRVDGVPVTSVARTLLDVATVAPDLVGTMIDAAGRDRIVALETLTARLDAGGQGLPGFARFASEVNKRVDWLGRTESELEDRFIATLQGGSLRLPELQYWVQDLDGNWYRLDGAYPETMSAIELDGYRFHADPASFDHDRAKQNALNELGWTTYRYGWRHLDEHRDVVLRQMRRAAGLD